MTNTIKSEPEQAFASLTFILWDHRGNEIDRIECDQRGTESNRE
jgi:hypothetical protein